ncbi:hypothetical protein SEUCBS140593_010519 [Sporothrix eucalyptigena]|uniref:beta-glucosidase n=1 Tax=Sporothrix eucalyptigena TaxID=1812306 RepID=A0ABP0D2M1_9PEZI
MIAPSVALGLVALARAVVASNQTIDELYFYGMSPPVYPTPNGSGIGKWATAYSKAKALVGQMTLDEKVNLTAGVSVSNGCSGNIPGIARLGFPGMCLSDAGNGLRNTDYVNAYASGISVGASWNRELAFDRGWYMGREFKTKGVNIALGPVVGPLGRVAEGGRNWEGFANDPYLCGALAYETVTAMQSAGVATSVKHFIAYEQETDRNPSGDVASVSSNLDDRTMHELYMWPFQDTVHAGATNIMCSYNRINGSHACQNSKTINGLLKEENGFQGFVVTDWGGQHSGVASALAGLDMAMPNSDFFWGANLTAAVQNGTVPESRVTDMVTRIIASWYQLHQDVDFPEPGIGMPSSLLEDHTVVNARNKAAAETLYRGAVEGHVLVKNTNNALPLSNDAALLSLFGYAATAQTEQGPLANVSFSFGSGGIAVQNYTMITGGGSGANSPAYISTPFDAITNACIDKGCSLYWDFESAEPSADPDSSACLVFVNAYATEGFNRPNLHDDYTDAIILSVAATCNNTIVVFQNAGVRLVDTFVDHENITAIVFSHLPGQDSGRALAALLWGEENFSGKLPYSVAKNETDYGVTLAPSEGEGAFVDWPQSNFTEGLYIDYRLFDKSDITPRYEFGFGLSYTTFEFRNLSLAASTTASTAEYPTGAVAEGGQTDLWDLLYQVTATVINTGLVDGAEVAQLYIGIPNAPVKQLRGFAKPQLMAGESAVVNFALTRRDLSIWNINAQKWQLQSGTYNIYVGSSSSDLPLSLTFSL